MRKVEIKISGRKIEGYPTVYRMIEFESLEDFITKADAAIEDTNFGKVDCCVDNFDNVFNESEVEELEKNWFFVE